MDKEKFFKEDYIPHLRTLKGDEKGKWGVLSPQGMIEHMTDSIGVAWGRITEPMVTPESVLPRMRDFALSDKEFKPETKNSLMSETPAPLRKRNMEEAIDELQKEIGFFFDFHSKNPGIIIRNPFFGDFNFQEWLHLLHKHAIHHLKQFDVIK
jgi:hypothetical protein